MPARRRSERAKQVNIRLTEAEFSALSDHAAAANLDLSTFVRSKALEKITESPTRRVMSAQTAETIRALSTVGIALHQIVRLYETEDGEARARLLACLADVKNAILSLRA